MSFYDLERRANELWGGNDPPQQSRARIFLDLYALQSMSTEERLAKSERLEKVFKDIGDKWAAQGFNGRQKMSEEEVEAEALKLTGEW